MLIDRTVDYLPIFQSSTLFESQIDLKYGINCGQSCLPSKNAETNQRTVKNVLLNSLDPLYLELRQLPLNEVNSVLSEQVILAVLNSAQRCVL